MVGRMVAMKTVDAHPLRVHQRGEDGVRLGGRFSSGSQSLDTTNTTNTTNTTTSASTSTTTTTTTTRGSAGSPKYQGRACLQPHRLSHDDQPPGTSLKSSLTLPPTPNYYSPSKKRPPGLAPVSHPPRNTCSPSSRYPAPATSVSHPFPGVCPFPTPSVAPRTLRRIAGQRGLRFRAGRPSIKIPQLPRLSENVRRLSPELRLHLQESLQRLQQQQAPSEPREELLSVIQVEQDGPKFVLEARETLALEEALGTCGPDSRSPRQKTHTSSVTSDYYSDSGETSFPPSLIQDHEFVLNLDLVDEESQSSRAESRATTRSPLGGESSSASPLTECPLEADDSRFLRGKNGDSRFHRQSDAERSRFLLTTPDRENCISAEKLGGKLNVNPTANESAKKDFLKLVPETRLSSVKSFLGSDLSLQHISLPASHSNILNLNSNSLSSTPPPSFNWEPQCPRSPLGAKVSRGPHPTVSWQPTYNPLQVPDTSIPVDDTSITKMDIDKGSSSSSVGGLGPLSFSMSSLSGSSSPALESVNPARTPAELHTNSLNRRRPKRGNDREEARRSWGPADKEEGNRDFWASIQEPYNYIMGSNLIPDSCQVGETTEAPSSGEFELSWDSGDVSPPYVWSFSEFLDQYNELYEWLIQVQLKLYSHSNPPDKAARMVQQEELRRRTYRRKLFVEQGERVAQRYPGSAEEISWRVNYLNNKWDQLESTFTPAKGRNQEVEVELDLAHEEGILRRWLSDMEDQIQPLTCRLPRGCSLLTLQDRYKDNQILLKDIEAHGPVLKSVLRQYERIAAAAAAAAAAPPTAADTEAAGNQDPHPTSTNTSRQQERHHRRGTKDNIPRKARSLEKRWHQIYLRSLEWHYYLEGVIANFKDRSSSSSSDSEDEPVNKLRRLSTSSSSCGSSCGSACGSPCPPSTRRPRTRRWSAYDSSLSEAGSYIELAQAASCSRHAHETKDDYVCVSGDSECGAAPSPCTSSTEPHPEPMLVDPEQEPPAAATTTTTAAAASQDPETPNVTATSCTSSASGHQEDHVMVVSAGLDTVRARCGQPAPADILADVPMIHDAVKSPTAVSNVGVTTTTLSTDAITITNTTTTSTDCEMENVNQVNGNTVSPSTTDDSGLNLSPATTEVSVNNDMSGPRDSPSKTSCTNVERPSPNCATFDFKHQDTDTEEAATNTTTSTATAACQANLNLVQCDPSKNRVYQIRRRAISTVRRVSARSRLDFSCDEEVDHEALQKIIDSAVPDDLDWLNSNMPSDLSGGEEEEDELVAQERMDTGSDGGTPGQQQERPQEEQEQPESQRSISKESLTRLVSDAERLVREPAEADEPPLMVSPRPHQLTLNVGSGCGVVTSKQARVRQWIASQRREARLSATCVLDSCDASGELTTGESDIESASSDDMDASTATQHATSTRGSMRGSQKSSLKGSRDPLPSNDNTPTTERVAIVPSASDVAQAKVVLRNRKRRSGEQRPWSVSELYQLATRLDLAPYSVSETALHNLLTATPETPTNDNQAFGAGIPNTAVTTATAGSSTTPTDSATNITTTTTTPSFIPNTTSTPSTASITTISTSATVTTSIPPVTTGRQSPPITTGTGSLRRRKTKARRKSNLSLGRRTDSGSEGITLNLSGGSDNIHLSPDRRLSLSKSHSSGSDTTSQSRRHIVKSSSFSGACRGGSGGMTSSTEKCVSDCGGVLGVPRTPPHTQGNKCYTSDDSRPTSPVPVIRELAPTRSPAHTARSNTHMSDQEGQNTHEDMSSLSEQAWDPYQEYKYLSEPYSEDIDQEAARRLLEFGDDYRKYIDSDGASSFSGIPYRGHRSPHHRRLRSMPPPGPRDLDSDSDLDDLHHVIDESRSQLTVTENVLRKYSSESAIGLDYAEIVATTQTNIKCLKEIVRHLQMEGTLEPELQEVESIVQRWEVVQAQAVERQRQRGQIRELQRQVKALRQVLETLTSRASELTQAEDIDSHQQLTDKLQEAKALQQEVLARKVEVSSVNLAVHRFHTETGYSLAPLKDDVADLFRVWDEADRRVNSEVSRLEGVEATWKLWETQAEELTKALRQDGDTLKVLDAAIQTGPLTDTVTASVQGVARLLNDRRKTQPGKKLLLQHTKTQGVDIQGTTVSLGASGDECLSDSGTSGYESCSSEEFSERERRLAHLRKLARDLEASLHPNSQAWAAICKTLSSAETELKGLQKHCRELVVRSAETLDQAKPSPQLRRRSWAKDSKIGRTSRRGNNFGVSGRDSSGRGNGRRGWMWRVVRAALPFQAALLLLFCVACLLEPNCCDHVNTLNLSLSPQLRYVHGPPPV
ncbi:uncharacterized protein klar isoform X1 [Panulirus ornatus]|uniref:uncharacterized protein klar isoform X1 n=1 Tax=Panulirus ornatus TaxID=150431 RepID=UPI003A840888